MNIIFHSVNDLPVGQRIDNGYISLTDMAKSQNRLLESWLFLKETTLLLKEFKETPEYAKLEPIITAEGQNNRIWGHPDVAIVFAQWCNPHFGLRVSRWVREWFTNKQNQLNTKQHISSESDRVLKAHLKRSQALNRTIHTAIHQQTDAIRDALKTLEESIQSQTIVSSQYSASDSTLNTLEESIQSQTILIQSVSSDTHHEKQNQFVSISCTNVRRRKGQGSGRIHWRTLTKNGKNYPQAYYHYEFRSQGHRIIKSTKYIPKQLLPMVEKLEREKAPVKEILQILGVAS